MTIGNPVQQALIDSGIVLPEESSNDLLDYDIADMDEPETASYYISDLSYRTQELARRMG